VLEREVAAPAIGDDEPGTQTAPGFYVFAAVGEDGAVGLEDGDGVTTDFHGEIAGSFNARGFKAEVSISGVGEFAEQALDCLGTVGWVVVRDHECAVLGEEGAGLIIVSGVERSDKILSKVADQGRDVQKRT